MPRQLDQLPPDATFLAREVRALKQQVAELRAARRAAHTALTAGGFKVYQPDSSIVAAEMLADLGDGNAGFQTNSTDGTRYARLQSGELTFGSPDVEQVLPTGITAHADGGTLEISSGLISGGAQAHIIMASGDSPLAISNVGGGAPFISLEWDGAGSTDMVVDVSGILAPRNFVWGSASITPSAANTPTSLAITGLTVRGTTFTAQVTPGTSVPGTTVTGVGATNVTSSGVTLWVTRTNTTATTLYWEIRGQ